VRDPAALDIVFAAEPAFDNAELIHVLPEAAVHPFAGVAMPSGVAGG
jgi:hypothetical protein